jgi:hypothetical protein
MDRVRGEGWEGPRVCQDWMSGKKHEAVQSAADNPAISHLSK